jgi:hypothetical protein
MIISIAISFTNGSIWTCAEDFESAQEGFLYAQERTKGMGKMLGVVTAPLRATGLVMSKEIARLLRAERTAQRMGL